MSHSPASLHAALLARGETVGCAESLTGGELASQLSRTPGASATFAGGLVTYATSLKRRLLGVTASEVVSAECAVQMATGARELLDVQCQLLLHLGFLARRSNQRAQPTKSNPHEAHGGAS